MDSKPWYASSTIWTNLLAIGATIVQARTGVAVDPEIQVSLLGLANLALRMFKTNKAIN
jgi:hypothetical protein